MTLVTQHALGCDGNTSHHQIVTSLLCSGSGKGRAGSEQVWGLFLSPAAENAHPEPSTRELSRKQEAWGGRAGGQSHMG